MDEQYNEENSAQIIDPKERWNQQPFSYNADHEADIITFRRETTPQELDIALEYIRKHNNACAHELRLLRLEGFTREAIALSEFVIEAIKCSEPPESYTETVYTAIILCYQISDSKRVLP